MFTTNGTYHITAETVWPRENVHVIIVAKNTTLQIARIFLMRPRSIMPRRNTQLVGAVVGVVVDVVADAKVTAISGGIMIRMGIEIIMEMVFKR